MIWVGGLPPSSPIRRSMRTCRLRRTNKPPDWIKKISLRPSTLQTTIKIWQKLLEKQRPQAPMSLKYSSQIEPWNNFWCRRCPAKRPYWRWVQSITRKARAFSCSNHLIRRVALRLPYRSILKIQAPRTLHWTTPIRVVVPRQLRHRKQRKVTKMRKISSDHDRNCHPFHIGVRVLR